MGGVSWVTTSSGRWLSVREIESTNTAEVLCRDSASKLLLPMLGLCVDLSLQPIAVGNRPTNKKLPTRKTLKSVTVGLNKVSSRLVDY